MKKEENKNFNLGLRIKLDNLQRIVSGEKKEEYRSADDFYFKKFGGKINENAVFSNSPKIIKFYVGNEKNCKYAICEIKEIAFEQFINFIPENFNKFDEAFTIYIEKIIETNLI
jgi:hypothetical protein